MVTGIFQGKAILEKFARFPCRCTGGSSDLPGVAAVEQLVEVALPAVLSDGGIQLPLDLGIVGRFDHLPQDPDRNGEVRILHLRQHGGIDGASPGGVVD